MKVSIYYFLFLLNTIILNAQTLYTPLQNDTSGLYQLKKQILASKDADIKSIVDTKNKVEIQKSIPNGQAL